MKRTKPMIALMILLLAFAMIPFSGFAQGKKVAKKAWPDTLTMLELQGTVIIDSTHKNIYFLDVDNDATADYKLAFGPHWYEPESGATRPQDGDAVTILGTAQTRSVIPVIIVFEINGLIWREAIEDWWNRRERYDSLEVVTETGMILMDTTYFYPKYFLDTNNDSIPEFRLNFGPHWYEPESGAVRPDAGVTVTIEGAYKQTGNIDRLLVLKIDNLVWREKYGPAPWRGRWAKKEHKNSLRFTCPYDTTSWLEIPPGALRGKGNKGQQFADSTFCEFWRVWWDSLPGEPDSVRGGWHLYFENPAGKRVNGKGKAVRFVKRLRLHLDVCGDSCGNFLAKSGNEQLELRYWDENSETWLPVEGAAINLKKQTIDLDTESLETYYAVFQISSAPSAVNSLDNGVVKTMQLEQNYPNPFNPETHIRFQTHVNADVTLAIFNLLGQEMRTLVNAYRPAGNYHVAWDGRDNRGQMVTSGTYFYKLTVGEQTQIKRLVLLK